MKDWMRDVVRGGGDLAYGVNIHEVVSDLGTRFHDTMAKGAALRQLQHTHLHLAYWETPYYKAALDKFLRDVPDISNIVFADVGCGDGRFTEYLLDRGAQRIVASDSDIKVLRSLESMVNERGDQDKVLILQTGADSLPLRDRSVDILLAIGVFYYLNNRFDNALDEAHRVLSTGGLLINSEPDLDGAIYKSICLEGLDDVVENFTHRHFKEQQGDTEFKFRLFSKKEVMMALDKHGFDVVDRHGLSLLPSLLRIKMVRGEFDVEQVEKLEKELRQVFDDLDGREGLHKHVIWKSRKRG